MISGDRYYVTQILIYDEDRDISTEKDTYKLSETIIYYSDEKECDDFIQGEIGKHGDIE